MAKQKKGASELSLLEAKQAQYEASVKQLQEQLQEAMRKEQENKQKLRVARIANLGNSVEPFVLKFNGFGINIFDFMNDAQEAISRGDAIIVNGNTYKKSMQEAGSVVKPSAEPDADENEDEEEEVSSPAQSSGLGSNNY